MTEEEFTAEESNVIRHFTAVGMIATAWASIELILDSYALALAGLGETEVAQCFTAQVIGSARKIDAYIAVAMFKGATKLAGELDSFAKDTAGLAEQRNRIVHDPWDATHPGGPRRLEVSARRKLKTGYVTVPIEDVFAFHDKLQEHIVRLKALHQRIESCIGTLPSKSYPAPQT